MCAEAGHIANSLWFALGVLLTIRASRLGVASVTFAVAIAAVSFSITASGDLVACLSGSSIGDAETSLEFSVWALVSGVLTALALLSLVWIAQLTVGVLAQLLAPSVSGRYQRDLQQRLSQIMTLFALIITFSSGFAEQMIRVLQQGSGAKSFAVVAELGGAALRLASQGVLLIVIPLAAVFVVLILFTTLAERLLEGKNFASVIVMLRAPLVLVVFLGSLTAIDLFLNQADQQLRETIKPHLHGVK